VVPHFAGAGILTGELIPGRLGLAGPETERDGRRILYTRPVGSHPAVPSLLRRSVLALCAARGIDPDEAALLIVGHGSNQPGRSSGTPEAVAAALRAEQCFAEVAAAFIEQAPRVADWPRLVAAPTVIAAPLLISEGMHARRDLPPLFGLAEPSGGPGRAAGRDTWLMPGIGRLAEVADLVLDQIAAADALASESTAESAGASSDRKLRMERPAVSGHCWPPISAA
jgi:sirohydrochlorin cobaltochelatase